MKEIISLLCYHIFGGFSSEISVIFHQLNFTINQDNQIINCTEWLKFFQIYEQTIVLLHIYVKV